MRYDADRRAGGPNEYRTRETPERERGTCCELWFWLLLLFIFQLFSIRSYAQGMHNLWLGGKESFSPIPFGGSTIDFQNGVANIFYDNRPIDIYHTSANISDSLGNLLFYTNGVVVGNNQGDTMVNGTGLNPSSYTDNWYPDGLLVHQGQHLIAAMFWGDLHGARGVVGNDCFQKRGGVQQQLHAKTR